MTGPEHFKHAEQSLAAAAEPDLGSDMERYCLAEAQVHAALANAAATALAAAGRMPIAEYQAWADACGESEEAATKVTLDISSADALHVLTQALGNYAAEERGAAENEGGNARFEQWARIADEFQAQAEAAG